MGVSFEGFAGVSVFLMTIASAQLWSVCVCEHDGECRHRRCASMEMQLNENHGHARDEVKRTRRCCGQHVYYLQRVGGVKWCVHNHVAVDK
jgi:hypothetical protein